MNSEEILNYRNKLVNCGKDYTLNNPDNLSPKELLALSSIIFAQLNSIDTSFGFDYYDIRMPKTLNVSKEEGNLLFLNFIDWYEILPTFNEKVLKYVLEHYPKNDYQNILCVGDGEKCHLGRKLAMNGYKVISIDPLAEKGLPQDSKIKSSGGSFNVEQSIFTHNSQKLINWSNIIVGNKIPSVVEEILNVKVPAVFTISCNAEIYNMNFNGIKITSSEQLSEMIKANSSIRTSTLPINEDDKFCTIFDKSGIQKIRTIQPQKSTISKSDNLNNLSSAELERLEQFVLSKNKKKEIAIFFASLKSGKLKDKKVDVDALDFVSDGLSSLVECALNQLDSLSTLDHDEK